MTSLSVSRKRVVIAMLVASVSTGCDFDVTSGNEPAAEDAFQISGAVFDAVSGTGIPGALIEFTGVAHGVTDPDGKYRFGDARQLTQASTQVMRITARGYAPLVVELRRTGGSALVPSVRLTPLSALGTMDAAGASLIFPNGVRIQAPQAAPIVSTSFRTALSLDIPLVNQWIEGKRVIYAAVHVASESFQLAQPVRVSVPLRTRLARGALLHVYGFQPTLNRWEFAGTATLQRDGEHAEFEIQSTGTYVIVDQEGNITFGHSPR